MKRYSILALALVLGCTIFTGCRRGNGNMDTVSPTNDATIETPTLMPTTPATQPTHPVITEPATQDPTENSTTEGATDATGETGSASRGRKSMPNMK